MEKAENNDRPEDAQDVALCHNCLMENDPQTYFCRRCELERFLERVTNINDR